MRQLILDTETTGLDPKLGHRIIEIAAVELVHRRPTGRHLHFHVNPEREIDAGATDVHGMTWDDLKGKPRFHERRRRVRRLRPRRASGSSTTRRSTSPSSTTSFARRACRCAATLYAARHRHAGARARVVPGQAQQPRRAVRALRRRQRASHAARRAARRAAARRGLPRDDARPGDADHRPRRADGRDRGRAVRHARRARRRAPAAARDRARATTSSPRIAPTSRRSTANRRAAASGSRCAADGAAVAASAATTPERRAVRMKPAASPDPLHACRRAAGVSDVARRRRARIGGRPLSCRRHSRRQWCPAAVLPLRMPMLTPTVLAHPTPR